MAIEGLVIESVVDINLGDGSAESTADRRRQVICVLRIDSRSKCTVSKRVDTTVSVSAYHTGSTCDCFKKSDPESLARAGHDEHIGQAVIIGQFLGRH